MEQGIVDVVVGAMSFQFVERVFEGKPLADAEMKLAFFFHLFEDEEVVPVAEVLHAGDTVGEGVVDGQLVAFAALFGRGRRNDFVDEALRGFAKDAGGFAVGVEVDGAALRWQGFAGDAGGCERGGIGDGDVAVDAIKEGGMIAGDFVEILARGQGLVGPEGVVPVAASEPVACGSGVGCGFDLREHVGEGFDAGEVDVELGAACAAEVRVRVVEAGEDEGVRGSGARSCRAVLGPARRVMSSVVADGEHFAAADGHGLDDLRLVFSETFAGIDDAIEEDDVGRSGGVRCCMRCRWLGVPVRGGFEGGSGRTHE